MKIHPTHRETELPQLSVETVEGQVISVSIIASLSVLLVVPTLYQVA